MEEQSLISLLQDYPDNWDNIFEYLDPTYTLNSLVPVVEFEDAVSLAGLRGEYHSDSNNIVRIVEKCLYCDNERMYKKNLCHDHIQSK